MSSWGVLIENKEKIKRGGGHNPFGLFIEDSLETLIVAK